MFLLFFGRLLLRYPDREVVLAAGEFIIVPRGVEHLPEALSEERHVVLIAPRTTLDTGDTLHERTALTPERLSLQGQAEPRRYSRPIGVGCASCQGSPAGF
jgi:hypothetical protein